MKRIDKKNHAGTGWKLTHWLMSLSALLFVITGCASNKSLENSYPANYQTHAVAANTLTTAEPVQPETMILREGNVVTISFPGSASLDTTQQIRKDGKIVMPLIGELTAAGKSPVDLQDELIKLYAPQVATKQVIVTVQSSSFPIYVTGAVLHPGKVMSDHPISALEAIMEAGGVDYNKADLTAVVIIRQGKSGTTTHTLNLKKVMKGTPGEPFYLEPSDIVRVPEKFSWF